MSLRLKFGILLGLFGLAVVLTLSASWITLSKLQTEVRDPLRSMSSVLTVLGQSKTHIEQARALVRPILAQDVPPVHQPDDAAKFAEDIDAAKTLLDRPDLASEWRIRSGRSALNNLKQRADRALALGKSYFAQASSPRTELHQVMAARQEVFDAIGEIHDLIERIEDRIVADTRATVDFSDDFRLAMLLVLAASFLLVILTCVLGVTLVRRWILSPVASLRAATARIASGDFSHRIPVQDVASGRTDELHQLSSDFNHMAATVKTLQDERVEQERLAALGEMIRRLAHNLRNPLGGIRSLAETTRSELNPAAPEQLELREHQTKIILAVDRFEKWLNELLGVTRPLHVQPVLTRVDRWLAGLADAHRPAAETRGITLELDTATGPTEVPIDSRHLEHALSAIISNAIESTSSPQARGAHGNGGAIRITTQIQDQHIHNDRPEAGWTISVTDQGTGVPPRLRESIFRPYFTTKPDGNGIGLAVALQVVKAHGGRIEVESPWPPREIGSVTQPNDAGPLGAKFTIYLPLQGPDMANDVEEEVAKNGLDGVIGGQDPRHRR